MSRRRLNFHADAKKTSEMSAQKKRGKTWTECSGCGGTFPSTPEPHCTPGRPWDPSGGVEAPAIVDATAVLTAAAAVDDWPELTGWLRLHLVALHPDTMRRLRLRLLDPVIVSDASGEADLAVVWASEKLSPFMLALGPSSALRGTGPIRAVRSAGALSIGLRLRLSPEGADRSFSSSPAFAAFLQAHLADGFLSPRIPLRLTYFGQACALRLVDGQTEFRETSEDTDELGASISTLSLTGGDSTTSPIATSTPKKPLLALTEQKRHMMMLPEPETSQVIQISSSTEFCVTQDASSTLQDTPSFDDIGGLKSVKAELSQHIVENGSGVDRLLLHGQTGTGKSILAAAVAARRPASTVRLLSDIDSTFPPQALIIIDSLDDLLVWNANDIDQSENLYIEGSGKKEGGETLRAFRRFLDEKLRGGQKLLATTASLDKVPVEIRRRFDLEVEAGVPSPLERREILIGLVRARGLRASETTLCEVADAAHSYTGADLAALCKLAAADGDADFARALRSAMKRIQPSAMKSVSITIPKVKWDDVAGQEEIKFQLKQCVEWPLRHPEAFSRMGVTAPKGILLYGPPGCSKTLIARAVASSSGLNFLSVKGPELFSKWVGESERGVRDLFARARRAAPCVVFFDEVDALGLSRGESSGSVGDRVVGQLLTEMDGLEAAGGVVLIAATNRPDVLDPALVRPGRLDRAIFVPLPSRETRRGILGLELGRMPTEEGLDLDLLASETDGFSGAEVVALCREAAMAAIAQQIKSGRDDIRIHQDHLSAAFAAVTPRTSPETLKIFEKFAASLAK